MSAPDGPEERRAFHDESFAEEMACEFDEADRSELDDDLIVDPIVTRLTVDELAQVALDPCATHDTIRLAISCAYQLGRNDAHLKTLLRDLREEPRVPALLRRQI